MMTAYVVIDLEYPGLEFTQIRVLAMVFADLRKA